MKLYLIRHGRAQHKEDGCYHNAELTEHGIEQIIRLSKFLKNIKIDKIYCSPMKRTMQTLEIIRNEVNNVPIEISKELVERSRGIYEQKQDEELIKALQESGLESTEFRPEGGENYWDILKRIKNFFEVIKKDNYSNVVLITHSGIITTFLLYTLNLPPEEHKFMNVKSGSVTIVELDENFKVRKINIGNSDHLVMQSPHL